MEITTEQAVKQLTKELKEDEGYWISWQANIAMAFVDCERWARERGEPANIRTIANEAADYFLNNLTSEIPTNRGAAFILNSDHLSRVAELQEAQAEYHADNLKKRDQDHNQIEALRDLLSEFLEVHDEPCRFDHHGYCQAHFLEDDCIIKRTKEALNGA